MALGAAAALSLAACGSDAKSSSTSGSATTAAAGTSAASATTTAPMTSMTPSTMAGGAATTAAAPMATNAVSIGDFKFEPADITVAVGTTVTWTNNNTQPHTATSAGNFDTGAIQPGASMTVTFDKAGTFSYICSFHPFMTGSVTVA